VSERRRLGGRYAVRRSIGHGGMAQVYEGEDTVLNRTVAIKVLAPQYARDEGFVQRFRREAQAAAKMNHPGIVSVYDTGSDDTVHYIVMEYVQGRTLAEVLSQEGRLQPERAAEVARAVATALSFAHQNGIVHRDVKPGNIMISSTGEVKVMDFGIARAMSTDSLTHTATVLGTASYLSPEQAQGEPLDARTDIYSLGCVLYEMLTGQPPFSGETPVAVAYKHVREEPTLPSVIAPEVPHDLEAVAMKAMAKNPANRYSSAEEMAEDLGRVLHGQPVAATPILPGTSTVVIPRTHEGTAVLPPTLVEEEERRRSVWPWVLVGILIAGLIALGLVLLAKSLIGSTATVEVPNLIGHQSAEAENRLRALKLIPQVEFAASKKPPDTVIAQDPDPGTKLNEGDHVGLTVSAGPRTVSVPDITGKTEDEARLLLARVKLDLGQRSEAFNDTVPEGQIISQVPRAGDSVPPNTTVDYVVSTGKQKVAVPNVICKTEGQAITALRTRGLEPVRVGVSSVANPSCPQEGLVAATNPGPGDLVLPSSTVNYTVNPAPPPTTTPPPSPTTTAPSSPPPTSASPSST
jgi:eukaryotic-like serine/threonine-protein kinase